MISGWTRRALRVCARAATFSAVLLATRFASAETVRVPPDGDLQAAIMNAQPGDVIMLAPGATYVGNFTLPNNGGSSYITVETDPAGLPGDGARISPDAAAGLAKLRSPNSAPALQTAPAAHHWRIVLIEFQANPGGFGDIIELGDGSGAQNAMSQVPHDLVIDRVYIHGDPSAGQKRAIALNSGATTISGSYISDIKAIGQDSQAIAGWNGPGPYNIINNYLEAAGENVLFGGADPSIRNLTPSDITFTGNYVSKPTSWRAQKWTVKNLFELKNARRVTAQANLFENNWQGGQSGFGILFTVRNQDSACTWCQVAQVSFESNIVRHSAAGISILGYDDDNPSQQTEGITVRNNLFYDIDSQNWGGNGYFMQLLGAPRTVTVDHNTVIQDHANGMILIDSPPILEFTFTNNLIRQNAYGIIGADHAPGNDSISAFFPGSLITRNVIADADPSRYPGGNSFPTTAQFQSQFVSYATGDFRLIAASPWLGAGSDGATLGANMGVAAAPVPSTPPVSDTAPAPDNGRRPWIDSASFPR